MELRLITSWKINELQLDQSWNFQAALVASMRYLRFPQGLALWSAHFQNSIINSSKKIITRHFIINFTQYFFCSYFSIKPEKSLNLRNNYQPNAFLSSKHFQRVPDSIDLLSAHTLSVHLMASLWPKKSTSYVRLWNIYKLEWFKMIPVSAKKQKTRSKEILSRSSEIFCLEKLVCSSWAPG